MARWLVLIVCGFLVLFALSGAACSKMVRSSDQPANGFEYMRCIEGKSGGDAREHQCVKVIESKTMMSEKFLREKRQPARKVVV